MPGLSSYNLAEIPNSYPPLAFYLTGMVYQITGISVMKLLFYLPFIFSVLTMPIFFGVTRVFFSGHLFNRALATFLFATLPRSFEWFVMGGGITRSLGFFFALTAIYCYSKAITKDRIGAELLFSGLFSSFTILSHPVAGLFLAFSLLVLTIYYWPLNLRFPIIIGAIALLGSSPWWISILLKYGLSPFVGAANTGHLDWFDFGYILTLNFNFENRFFLPFVSVLAILGLFSKKRKEATFLGVLVGLGYLAVPRGGVDLLTSHLAMLAVLGFTLLIESWDRKGLERNSTERVSSWLGQKTKIFLLFILVYSSIGAYSYKYIDSKADLHLTGDEYEAMIWIRENTEDNAALMHLPPSSSFQDWWNDYFGEWMPAITQRHSVATVQGYEWLPGGFGQRIEQYHALRSCTGAGVDCVESWVITYDNKADYLLLSKRQHSQLLINDFLGTSEYLEVYENEDVLILQRDYEN
jgi:hypothetical protein